MDNLHLIILTGKTASGKDTVMAKLLSKSPSFRRVITTTSRPLRNGEQNQVDYYFITEADFRSRIETGDFIEYVTYAGNLYGTTKEEITKHLNEDLIWRIDPSRAGQIRQFIKDAFDQDLAAKLLKRVLVIYLTVDDQVILKRLTSRGVPQEEIDRRMQEDREFWQKYKDKYDFVIENVPGQLDQTVDKIIKIVENHPS